MAGVPRAVLRLLAVAIAAAPFVLAGLMALSGTTSLAIVAPSGLWILAAIFIVPVLLGFGLWRLSAMVG